MKRSFPFLLLFFSCFYGWGQDDSPKGIASRIFLPSIDVGYQWPNSSLLGGAVTIKTTIEYRVRNNNDLFLRLSYDTYGSRYRLSQVNQTSNTIEGTVQVQDVLLGPGYRFGDKDLRMMIAVLPGIKIYEFPEANISGQQIQITQAGKSLFTTSFLVTFEYYFDQKSAFTLSLFENQVWRKRDFWADGTSAFGFTVGFITSLL